MSVSNNATGATREALTNETGAFRFSGLPPSSYSVTVEFPGFGTVTRPSVMLAVGGTTKVDFELDLGPITESITVTGAVPLVQPTENTVQVVVANQRVQELPSKSRDFMDVRSMVQLGKVRTPALDRFQPHFAELKGTLSN